MIKVTVLEDSDRVVRELKLTGHAGYGEEGQDIVCAPFQPGILRL